MEVIQVFKKTSPGWLILLMLLVSSTYLTYASGPPTPTPPQTGRDSAPIEISIIVRPDGTWEGEAHLSYSPSSAPSDLEGGLDAQVQQEAAAIWGGRGIRYSLEETLTDWDSPRIEGAIGYTFSLEGGDAREIVEATLGAGHIVERLEGPVALELRGTVRAGQTLTITLPGNPSTGYSWGVAVLDGSALSQVNDVETYPVSKGLGAAARQVVRLSALKTGQASFRLDYQRPWLADLPPAIVISIEPDGLDLADTCATLSAPLPPPAPALEGPVEGKEKEEQDTSLSSVQTLPSAYDWCATHGGCPPVRDQENCGSCWAFGTVGPLEAWIKYKDSVAGIDLAEQYLLSCNTEGWNCEEGGWWAHHYHLNTFPPSESEAGAVLESASPYQASDLPCGGPYSHPYKISSWDYVGSSRGVPSADAIKQAIYSHGPVAAAVCVGTAFQYYSGGVFQTEECWQSGGVNHAIVLVGWDDSKQAWILRNSWGAGWGESGYMRIGYGISNVGYAANCVVYTSSAPFVATDWVYLPLTLRNLRTTPAPSLLNGDFENGRDGSWSEYSSNGWDLILDSSQLTPHGGDWAAWLGGDNYETSILSQQIVIPSNGTTLNYWYWSGSEDICGCDFAYVRFGSTDLKAYNLCYTTNTGGWVFDQINVASWRGQMVELRFVIENDWLWNSNFFLDDVSISTTTATPALSISPDPAEASALNTTAPKGTR